MNTLHTACIKSIILLKIPFAFYYLINATLLMEHITPCKRNIVSYRNIFRHLNG